MASSKRRGWLPPSLRPPYLISVSIILLLMTIAIEILRQYSIRHDGVVQYKRKADLSSAAWRACITSPTAFALGAMLLWGICAQDVLRLEPYFCLASEHGAPASVLFINYRLDVGILAPIRAARNRHYVVLCVSVMSLLMRIALPSVLSGLIVTTPLTILERKSGSTWPHLVDLDLQERWYSTAVAGGFLYGIPGGNNSGDSSSSSYAIAPVSIAVDAGIYISALNQTVYWSSMACSNVSLTRTLPTTISSHNSTANLVSSLYLANVTVPVVGDSQCRVTIDLDTMIPNSDGRFQARHWEPMQLSSNLSSPSAFTTSSCPSVGLAGVIVDAEIKDGTSAQLNITTFVCEPVYQRAMANVSSISDSTAPSVEIYSSTVRPLTGQEFSMHGLQLLMSSAPTAGADPSLNTITNLANPANQSRVTLIGGSDIYHLEEYQGQLNNLWNAEFITTINKFIDLAASASQVDAELVVGALALTVIPKAAAIAETILVLASFVLLFLARRYRRSPSLLCEDPGSIAAQCAFIARLISPQTLQALSQTPFHSAKTRELRRWARQFWCVWEKGPRGAQLRISARDGTPLAACAPPTLSGRKDPMPHFLTLPWFSIECVLLVGAIAAFGLAYRYTESHNLESLTSKGLVITVFFLIFGPTLISSIISSLFDSIHRQVSVTDPWIRLRKGALSAEQLSASNQTFLSALVAALRWPSSITPAISALSFICLLNLVLILLCGGLFEPQQKNYVVETPLAAAYNSSHFATPRLQADFRGYDSAVHAVATDALYEAWTTMAYSALLLSTDESEESTGVVYSAATRGIGTELQCVEVPHDGLYIDAVRRTMNWTYTPFDVSESLSCSVELALDSHGASENRLSIRYAWPTSGSSMCQRQTFFIAASWIDNAGASLDAQNLTTLHCQPKIVIQDYKVQFTPRGIIQESEAVADSSVTTGALFNNASMALGDFNQGLGQFVRRIGAQQQQHHALPYQSSFPGRITGEMYMSYAFEHSTQTPPTTPPDPNTLIQAAQSLYQATFSTYLTRRRDYFLTPLPPDTAPSVNATATYTPWGLMPSRNSMALIIAIICIDVLALIAVFALYYGRYDAPRIPTTLGSLMPWVSGSDDMLRDLGKAYGAGGEGRVAGSPGKDREYCLRPGVDVAGKGVWVLDYAGSEVEGTELDIIAQSARPDRTVGNL